MFPESSRRIERLAQGVYLQPGYADHTPKEFLALAVDYQDVNMLFIRHLQRRTKTGLIEVKRDGAFARLGLGIPARMPSFRKILYKGPPLWSVGSS